VIEGLRRRPGDFPGIIPAPQPDGVGAVRAALEGGALRLAHLATLLFEGDHRSLRQLGKIVRLRRAQIPFCLGVIANAEQDAIRKVLLKLFGAEFAVSAMLWWRRSTIADRVGEFTILNDEPAKIV
jgi:hypothetical protein